MNERVCLQANECRRYCCALNDLTGTQETDSCEWPENIDAVVNSKDSTELTKKVATELGRVLKYGNEVGRLVEAPDSELGIAYGVIDSVHNTRVAMWQKYADAARRGRVLTDIEVNHYADELNAAIDQGEVRLRSGGVGAEELMLAHTMHDRSTIDKYSLLFDEGMNEVITQLCASAGSGRSALLIGDKGVAKTQAAKYVSGLFSPTDKPMLISGDGSMMKDEFIGKMTLSEHNGATVTTFKKGILTECMEEGVPLVIDEINLIDPAIAMRLQDILLRKPGDEVTIQENEGETVKIKTGFCIFATANEASRRYQSRAVLDPAFRDRFVVMPIAYPDGDTPIIQANNPPKALLRLAFAQAVTAQGVANSRVSTKDAKWLAQLSHASQQLYSKPARDINAKGLRGAVGAVVDNGEPRMSDCITPRRMVEILSSVGSGLNPYVTDDGVRGATYNAISGMQNREDRDTMFNIIELLYDDPTVQFDADTIKKRLRL